MSSPEARARAATHDVTHLESGWEVAACAPDERGVSTSSPTGGNNSTQTDWIAASVPGTAAGALREAGDWAPFEGRDFDAEDWWWRTRFEAAPAAAGEEVVLRFEGVATVWKAFLNGEPVAASESMFEAVAVDVGELLREGGNELAIRCLALGPLLRQARKPRARWRTKVADNALRHFRTSLLGRAPGFAPEPAPVGPWRPVVLERRRAVAVEGLELRPRCEGSDGVLALRALVQGIDGAGIEAATVVLDGIEGELRLGEGEVVGEVRLPDARRWWPHTHGDPALYEVSLKLATSAGEVAVECGRVGFRELAWSDPAAAATDPIEAGLNLHLNGVRVFARGAVWTPVDAIGLAPSSDRLRAALEQVRDAGMNMLRVVGLGAYESPAFHDLCDELGILVWQDFMYANFDYPVADEGFRARAEAEAAALLASLEGRPSLTVLCGNSEVEQQVAMLGLDPALGRGPLFGEILPGLCAAARPEVPYLPSSPCGGVLPFRPEAGIANYFGVGGYRRPLEDARRAEVKFAAECLAFANVPDEAGVESVLPGAVADVVVHHPRWKAGVPRDAGSGWDFEDVRDHYLRLLYGVDPGELRRFDHERYLELSRAVSGETMAAVFGEWRRAGSPCGGGLVLWLRDLLPGAGWGLVDAAGNAKAALSRLAPTLAPVAVWLTDEGLAGVGVHLANDRPERLHARLRIGLYRDREQRVGEGAAEIEIGAHESISLDLEGVLGRFADASWAYRFGPPAQDLIVASLESEGAEQPLSQAFFDPAGPDLEPLSAERLGLEARLDSDDPSVHVVSRRHVTGLRLEAAACEPSESWIDLEPGVPRRIPLNPRGDTPTSVALRALNLAGRLTAAAAGDNT